MAEVVSKVGNCSVEIALEVFKKRFVVCTPSLENSVYLLVIIVRNFLKLFQLLMRPFDMLVCTAWTSKAEATFIIITLSLFELELVILLH